MSQQPGSVQKIDYDREANGRVESGAVQFGDDWPGLFLRGDDAMKLLASIRALEVDGTVNTNDHANMSAFALSWLSSVADTISRDVIVK